MNKIDFKNPTKLNGISQIISKLFSTPLAASSLVIVLLFFLVGITADYISPYDPIKIDIPNKLSDPSWDHWLGTDQLGPNNATIVKANIIPGNDLTVSNNNSRAESIQRLVNAAIIPRIIPIISAIDTEVIAKYKAIFVPTINRESTSRPS